MRGEGRGSIFVYKPVTSIEINISSFRSFVFFYEVDEACCFFLFGDKSGLYRVFGVNLWFREK